MPRVSEEHRIARREQILRAAMQCVAEDGFHKTTMADVIRASGLSAGAVYGYFKGKQEIIAAIAEHALGLAGGALGELAARGRTPSIPELVHHLAATIETQTIAPGLNMSNVMVAAWAEIARDGDVRRVAAPKILELRSRVAGVVRDLQAEGRWAPETDAEQVAQATIALLPGFVLQRLAIGNLTADGFAGAVDALLSGGREPAA